jgi:hypothetical protein
MSPLESTQDMLMPSRLFRRRSREPPRPVSHNGTWKCSDRNLVPRMCPAPRGSSVPTGYYSKAYGYLSGKRRLCHGRPECLVPARMSLRHIRGTKSLRAAAQRAGAFRQPRESSTGSDTGAHDLVAAGVPARHFSTPGSKPTPDSDPRGANLRP